MANKTEYQPEIDGLRAFAVLAVVFFHAGVETFSGGYVGVDVFFVISGFLITRLICDQAARGTFSFSGFYIRRVRRLFPALIFTLAFCFIGAGLLLSPDHFRRAGGAVASATLSVSNFYFWEEAGGGYFAQDAEVKPLLHMWSLSVEEQFYLVWPALLVLLLLRAPRRFLQVAVIVAGVSSLWLNRLFIDEAQTIFYLAPFRAFEFAIGAGLVWLVPLRPRQKLVLEPVLIAGLCLILYSVVSFDKNTLFPGTNALIPCLGAAMAIYAGAAPYSGRLLNNPLAVGIGLISYSLYLIHWPLIVFYQYYRAGRIGSEIFLVVAAAVAAAVLMYRYVETPFRIPTRSAASEYLRPSAFALRCGALALAITGVSVHVWANDGWEWRIAPEIREAVSDIGRRQRATWKFVEGDDNPATAPFGETTRKLKLLIVGDSHSIDLFNAFHLNAQRFPTIEVRHLRLDEKCLYLFASSAPHEGLPAKELAQCEGDAENLGTSKLFHESDWVVFSAGWKSYGVENVTGFVDFASGTHHKSVAIFGKRATFRDVPQLLIRHGTFDGMERVLFDSRKVKIDALNERLKEISLAAGAVYIDELALSCSEETRRCHVVNEDGRLLILDRAHWSMEGAEFFGRRIAAAGLLDPILNTQKLTSSPR